MAFAETMATYQDARCLLIDADGQMSLSLMLADGMRLAQQSNNELTIVPLFQQLESFRNKLNREDSQIS